MKNGAIGTIKLELSGRLCLLFFGSIISIKCQVDNIEDPRALRLGGAYTAIAEGHDSVRVNPAGIAAKNIQCHGLLS